jgi:acylphosphatase
MTKHFNIQISGKVQGVGFRYFVRNEAEYFKIKGFVKNETDGSVYIEAEASAEMLEVFVQKCKTGAPHSRIDKFVISESVPVNFKMFEIL